MCRSWDRGARGEDGARRGRLCHLNLKLKENKKRKFERENSPAKPASPVKLSRDEATLKWNCNWNQAEALQNYQEENKGENCWNWKPSSVWITQRDKRERDMSLPWREVSTEPGMNWKMTWLFMLRRRELAGVRRWREAGGFSQVVFVVVVVVHKLFVVCFCLYEDFT